MEGGSCDDYELIPSAQAQSCVDIANNDPSSPDGTYHLDLDGDGTKETYAFCDFDGDFAWTLISSFSLENGKKNGDNYNPAFNVDHRVSDCLLPCV